MFNTAQDLVTKGVWRKVIICVYSLVNRGVDRKPAGPHLAE
jgi:hypothetical protein